MNTLPVRFTRPYRITRTSYGWVVWDRRCDIGTVYPGGILGPDLPVTPWPHSTHAAAIAALDAHLREQAATEPSA